MDSFTEWISSNKDFVIGAITLIITTILLFIKKRPKTIDDFLWLLDNVCAHVLPSAISKAEFPGNGLAKKKEVRDVALSFIVKKLGRALSDSEKTIALRSIDESIEEILSTPQKKL